MGAVLLTLGLVLWIRNRAPFIARPVPVHGIAVGMAKVYDNRSLSLMLEQLREQLRTLQNLDSQKVNDAVGSTQASQANDASLRVSAGAAAGEKSDGSAAVNKDEKSDNAKVNERALDLLADQVNLSTTSSICASCLSALSQTASLPTRTAIASTIQAVFGFPILDRPTCVFSGLRRCC